MYENSVLVLYAFLVFGSSSSFTLGMSVDCYSRELLLSELPMIDNQDWYDFAGEEIIFQHV
jgi:hypothetical protein